VTPLLCAIDCEDQHEDWMRPSSEGCLLSPPKVPLPIGDPGPHLILGSFGHHESGPQTASAKLFHELMAVASRQTYSILTTSVALDHI